MFPDDFKRAQVNPLLKKSTLPKENLNSYIHISNLSFVSRILDKIVANHLRSHIESSCMYKVFYVTLNMDKGRVTALTWLDVSAAFDTTDYNISIKHLSMWYVISGTALSWFSTHFFDRYQRVNIANCFSAALPTSCGVPPGSVLGPLLFTLHTYSSVIQPIT